MTYARHPLPAHRSNDGQQHLHLAIIRQCVPDCHQPATLWGTGAVCLPRNVAPVRRFTIMVSVDFVKKRTVPILLSLVLWVRYRENSTLFNPQKGWRSRPFAIGARSSCDAPGRDRNARWRRGVAGSHSPCAARNHTWDNANPAPPLNDPDALSPLCLPPRWIGSADLP